MPTTQYLLSQKKVSTGTADGGKRKRTTHVAYQKETSACPPTGGTLTYRAVSTATTHRKTVHIPWHNEEEHALKEPQCDYDVPHLEG